MMFSTNQDLRAVLGHCFLPYWVWAGLLAINEKKQELSPRCWPEVGTRPVPHSSVLHVLVLVLFSSILSHKHKLTRIIWVTGSLSSNDIRKGFDHCKEIETYFHSI